MQVFQPSSNRLLVPCPFLASLTIYYILWALETVVVESTFFIEFQSMTNNDLNTTVSTNSLPSSTPSQYRQQSVFQVEVLTYFLCYNYHDIEMRLKADRKFGCFCLCYGYASFHSLLQPLADCVSSNFFPLLLVGMKAKFAPFGISKGISREIQCQHPGNTHTQLLFCF